ESEAKRREREAEFLKRATAAENIQAAKAKEESYAAERDAENARAALEMARQEADIIVKAEIKKREVELEAEAQAEQIRRIARGEADATLMKMEAQAKGMREILIKQAEGFEQLVKAAGGEANDAIRYMVAEKLEELIKIQVEAIQNLKIDKITVWDSGGAGSADGKTTTANFLSGIIKAVPPLSEMFDMAGMKLPDYLGKKTDDTGTETKTE
ncbi:MAG TPA: flotillin family protein, partial [Bacillota bacterium]|nr:flotillin family protein [Bacillota bacterium]